MRNVIEVALPPVFLWLATTDERARQGAPLTGDRQSAGLNETAPL